MDINSIMQMVSTVGFPIVACLGCGFFVYKQAEANREDCNNRLKQIQETTERREERLLQQMDGFSKSLDRFNETLTRIDARLEVVENNMMGKN